MNIFKRSKETSLATKEDKRQDIVVAVPDIKEHLVKEYERVNDLLLENKGLEQQLEEARETEMKYKAALVTLDEYSKRLESAKTDIDILKGTIRNKNEEIRQSRDEVNSYKIKFNEAAITKSEIEAEIVDEAKKGIISLVNGLKGNLSKKIVCDIINSYSEGDNDESTL